MKILNRNIIGKSIRYKDHNNEIKTEIIKEIAYPDVIWTDAIAFHWFNHKDNELEILDGDLLLTEDEILKDPDGFVFGQFEKDWADEFDVEGCKVMFKEEYEDLRKLSEKNLIKIFENTNCHEIYFGTNEALNFESAEEYWECFSFDDCPEEVYTYINDITYGGMIGTSFPFPIEY